MEYDVSISDYCRYDKDAAVLKDRLDEASEAYWQARGKLASAALRTTDIQAKMDGFGRIQVTAIEGSDVIRYKTLPCCVFEPRRCYGGGVTARVSIWAGDEITYAFFCSGHRETDHFRHFGYEDCDYCGSRAQLSPEAKVKHVYAGDIQYGLTKR